jgi:hypothetical protein
LAISDGFDVLIVFLANEDVVINFNEPFLSKVLAIELPLLYWVTRELAHVPFFCYYWLPWVDAIRFVIPYGFFATPLVCFFDNLTLILAFDGFMLSYEGDRKF